MNQSKLLTGQDITTIYEKDVQLGRLIEGDPTNTKDPDNKDFREKDFPLYTVILNTYCLVIEDRVLNTEIRTILVEGVIDRLRNRGLMAYIEESNDFFVGWVSGGIIPSHPIFEPLLRTILSTEYPDMEGIQVAGEIFRFMKRFCPYGTVGLAAECEAKFWECETINKENDRECHTLSDMYTHIISAVKYYTEHFFKNWDKYDEKVIPSYNLSPNAVQHVCKNKLCKRVLLESLKGDPIMLGKIEELYTRTGVLDTDLMNPYLSREVKEEIVKLAHTEYAEEFVKIRYPHARKSCDYVSWNYVIGNPVPKDFKSYRMVSPDIVENYDAEINTEKKIRCLIRDPRNKVGSDPLEKAVPIDDQSLQRNRAQEGSVDGETDTLDFSSASDLHRKKLVRELWPNDISCELLSNVPKGIVIGKRASSLSMFAPMGSPLTFRVMQFTLFMVLYTCTMYIAEISHWSAKRTKLALARIGVFGDDVTCDWEVTQTFIEWIELLGFKVNINKSYVGKPNPEFIFREACGGDYVNGIDISAHYWPRKQFSITKKMITWWHEDGYTGELDDSLSVLINLSKSIRKFSPSAAIYLNSICRKIEPTLTMSEIGSTNPDLWSAVVLTKPHALSPYTVDAKYSFEYYHQEVNRGLRSTRDAKLVWKYDQRIIMESSYDVLMQEYLLWKRKPFIVRKLEDNIMHHPGQPRTFHKPYPEHEGIHTFFYRKDRSWKAKVEHEDSYLEKRSVPRMVISDRILSPNANVCIVESVLTRYNIDVSSLSAYYSYLDYLQRGTTYDSPLDELLNIPSRRDTREYFSNKSVQWGLTTK